VTDLLARTHPAVPPPAIMKSKVSPSLSFAGEERSAGVCVLKNVFNMPTSTCRDVTAEQDRDPMANAGRALWVPEVIYLLARKSLQKLLLWFPSRSLSPSNPAHKVRGVWGLLSHICK
jgi:hypothetical protein